MLKLTLEKTTGLLTPAGTAPEIPRAPFDALVQFLTNGVAELLTDGHPIALKIYDPADLVNPVATFNAWTANAAFNLYKGTLNPQLSTLAWTTKTTLLARISYGTPNVDTPLFHVVLGGAGDVGAPIAPIVITQPAGPVDYTETLGTFGGKAVVDQVEGLWKARAACQLLGLQLNAQDAPTGAALLVDVVKNGVAANKIATLAAASKAQETIFPAPLAVAAGDIIQFKPTQVGSVKPGTNLSVKAIVQLV